MVILGVDLRASAKRTSAVVALDCESNVLFFKGFNSDEQFLSIVERSSPQVIAIGAPLGLPDGLCCLETSCKCAISAPQKKGRQSEIELARLGISCFYTSKGSIIRTLIYRCIKLKQRLNDLGHPPIEVYPHATKVVLFEDKAPPKNSPASVTFLKERLTPLIGGLDSYHDSLDRNTCDAVLNAYTGVLHCRNSTDMLGSKEDGMLVLPRLPR